MYLTKSAKSPFYQLNYKKDGKITSISTKKNLLADAEMFMKDFTDHDSLQKNSLILPTSINSCPSISCFKTEYENHVKLVFSKSYVASIKTAFKLLIAFCGNVKLDKLDFRTVDKFFTKTFARTNRGALLYHRILKAAFNKAILWKYLSENIFESVTFPRVDKPFPLFLTENELTILLTNTTEGYLRDIIVFGFYTGLRLGELVNMRWTWVDLFNNQLKIKVNKEFSTKSKKERIVPLCEKAKSILTKRVNSNLNNSNGIVFYKKEFIKLEKDFVSKQFKKVVLISNVPESIHFHSLRHSFASNLAQKNVSLKIIQELLGHEDIATTQIYSHLQQQNLRDAVSLL